MVKGSKHKQETIEKLKKSHKGQKSWNKGTARKVVFICKTCGKIKEVPIYYDSKKIYCSIKCRGSGNTGRTQFKKGHVPTNGFKGRNHSKEAREKISKAFKREKHWNWQGGKSFEPYNLEFNKDLKEVIRNRDMRKCQLCGRTELE